MRTGILTLCLATSLLSVGCVGPMRLGRAVDQHYNQSYVDTPIITQVASPLIVVAGAVASTLDYLIVNPVFWWRDVFRNRGTPYYYKNPQSAGD